MTQLKAMCIDAGFGQVETYIASGNVVFESKSSPKKVKSELEARLLAYAGISVGGDLMFRQNWGLLLAVKP
jgi:uncharacterized protein (DUF1697 family)